MSVCLSVHVCQCICLCLETGSMSNTDHIKHDYNVINNSNYDNNNNNNNSNHDDNDNRNHMITSNHDNVELTLEMVHGDSTWQAQ